MKVALCSIFRSAERYIDNYFHQIADLRKEMDVELVLGEGDSVDLTLEILKLHVDNLVKVDHGGVHFGSVDNPQRWDNIAKVVRPVLAAAIELEPKVVVWVEADLIWEPRTILKLVESAASGRTVAPMTFDKDSFRFYDNWGYRQNGKQFLSYTPYTPVEGLRQGGFVKIDSCGSCFATRDLAMLADWDGRWPFPGGGELWLDTTIGVFHPKR